MIDNHRMKRLVPFVLIPFVICVAASAAAQDVEWVRMWEAAQRQRPTTFGSVARIAPANEPGTPLVVHGRILQSDGASPAAGVIVFAYQTDIAGVYNHRNAPGWRLRGWARTDAEGRFEFRTIRPASYPNGRIPAHIHLTIEGPSLPRRWTHELRFADDPFLSDREKREPGVVRVTTRGGVQHVEFQARITNDGRF